MKEVYSIADLRDWSVATADCDPSLRLAVIGDPVAHSKSPQMHNAALAACGIPARYTRLHIRPDELGECLELVRAAGFIGLNCTIPHKAAVLAAIEEADDTARRAGGVNTVIVEDGRLRGTSTDGPGLARAILETFGIELRQLRVMVFGAGGGAGRAITMQCAEESCERVVLVNRTVEKAQALAREIAPILQCTELLGPVARVAAIGLDDAAVKHQLDYTDLIINCTPVGMKVGDPSPVPPRLLAAHHLLYDTVYTSHRTPFLRAGDAVGARGENGLSMLLHQGVLSFEQWFQREAPIEVMRAALLK